MRPGAGDCAGHLALRHHDRRRPAPWSAAGGSRTFQFLLSIPIIVGTGLVQLYHLTKAVQPAGQTTVLALGFVAAAVTGYLAIRFLLHYLQQRNLYPFAIYCWVVGLVSLVAALTHVV